MEKEKKKTSNSFIVLKYMDIRKIIHFTNIYWDHTIYQTLTEAGNTEMSNAVRVPFLMSLQSSTAV